MCLCLFLFCFVLTPAMKRKEREKRTQKKNNTDKIISFWDTRADKRTSIPVPRSYLTAHNSVIFVLVE